MSTTPFQRICLLGAPRSAPGTCRSALRCLLLYLVCVWTLPAAVAQSVAAGADAASTGPLALVTEYVEAGEFAPAIALANDQADARLRDQMLSHVARAQAGAGAHRDSLSTAGQIRDDLLRSDTLRQASSERGGARGGGVEPDFDSLIDLIIETIAPESWVDVGGPGAIREFEAGVYVDAQGVMRRVIRETDEPWLDQLRRESLRTPHSTAARRESNLRKVSLVRLERAVQLRLAAGKPLDEEMQVLAGLERVQYVLLYPETGDIVLAGPAGDWSHDELGRAVSVAGGRPVVRLDDLVVLLRFMANSPGAAITCSIDPRPAALAAAKQFLTASSDTPLKRGQRNAWLEELRQTVGLQDVTFKGIDPATHVARVLLEADHHMKLVGIGLEEGTVAVPSYLDLIEVPRGQAPPPLGVMRWWFTMNYRALLVSPQRDAFHLRGQGVRVQSENEFLTDSGGRVQTGRSDDLNQRFAHNFTADFEALTQKYPVYAELQNIFDLALICALLEAEDLAEQVGWHMTCFGDPEAFVVSTARPPLAVETVINHRVINRKHIVAAVSGGVRLDPSQLVARSAHASDRTGELGSQHHGAGPEERPADIWWWD